MVRNEEPAPQQIFEAKLISPSGRVKDGVLDEGRHPIPNTPSISICAGSPALRKTPAPQSGTTKTTKSRQENIAATPKYTAKNRSSSGGTALNGSSKALRVRSMNDSWQIGRAHV